MPLLALVTLTAGAVAIGIWLRLSLLKVGSLWIDELWTLDAVSRSFKEMVGARLVSDQHPPLWNSVAWVWLRVVGTYDAGAMRLLPLGFSVAAIAAPLLGAVRMPLLRPTLFVMAALMATSLFALQYGVELRSYSMLLALGASATVVWAGLLAGALPTSGRWIFAFTLAGALAGFTHYYGHLLYFGEAVVLLVAWLPKRPWRPIAVLLGWGVLSVMPVVVWYLLTKHWFPVRPIAEQPSLDIIRAWLAYGLGPVTNVIAGHAPVIGYADRERASELILAGLVIAVLAGAAALGLRARRAPRELDRAPFVGGAVLVGVAAVLVVILGVVGAWTASLILPPSMNFRNLGALLPALLLGVSCAATLGRAGSPGRWSGALVVAAWIAATVAVTAQFGVAALAPSWQREAGYGATVRVLLASRSDAPAPALIGLEMPWDWHGHWDAAIRAELGGPPAESEDPVPLDVRWILDVEELRATGLPAAPLIVFTDASDERSAALFAWLHEARAGCRSTALGGPGYGIVTVVRCPGSG